MNCVILLMRHKYLPYQFTVLVSLLKARKSVSSLKATSNDKNEIVLEYQIENCIGSMKFVTENT